MTLTWTLQGQCKSGKNNMQTTKAGHHYPLPAFATWRDDMVIQTRGAAVRLGGKPIAVPCKLSVVFRHSDKRRRDVSGLLDALFHVLERAGVVKDDSLIQDVDVATASLQRDKPSVWMRLETDWLRTL
jgi:Holliday junction resolvase RusA-like endonuclease